MRQKLIERGNLLQIYLSSTGYTVSLVFIRQAEWLNGDTPFLSNVREDAISL